MISDFLAPYIMRIAGVLIVLLSIASIYQYIKNEGHEQAIAECNAKQDEFIADANDLQEKAKLDIEKAKQIEQEKAKNAIEIYINHFNSLTPAATSLRITTKESNACISGVSAATKDRSKVTEGNGGTGKAELPERNLQLLNAVISKIERLELNCERILNTMP